MKEVKISREKQMEYSIGFLYRIQWDIQTDLTVLLSAVLPYSIGFINSSFKKEQHFGRTLEHYLLSFFC